MTAHDHRTHVEGCYRCELSRDEVSDDPDTDPNTLADRLDAEEGHPDGGDITLADLRAAADGLRQLAMTESELTRFKALNEQSHRRNMEVLAEFYELQKQYAAITAAIGDPDELRRLARFLAAHQSTSGADTLRHIADAASVSPTPTPDHPDGWHDNGQP